MNDPELQPGEIPAAILAWKERMPPGPERDRLQMGLYRLVLRLSDHLVEGRDFNREPSDSHEDLAHGFLVELRQDHVGNLESVSGLKAAMKSYWTAQRDPAGQELWKILSDALLRLREEGAVRRVDHNRNPNNHNNARWTSKPDPAGSRSADLLAFEKHAEEKVSRFPPPKPSSGASDRTRKVISPSDAKKLVLALLEGADGWVTMGELFAAFKNKVFLFGTVTGKTPGGGSVQQGPVSEAESRLQKLAEILSEQFWECLRSASLQRLFCGYFVPKHLRDEKVAMKEFGGTSTVSDQNKRIVQLLGDLLDPGEALDEKEMEWHQRLAIEVLERAGELCQKDSGKSGDPALPMDEEP